MYARAQEAAQFAGSQRLQEVCQGKTYRELMRRRAPSMRRHNVRL
jgi:hypothetical protein